MKKSKKFFNKAKKGGLKPTTKKKRKAAKDKEVVNKKAIFNRYKNAQKIEEVLEKKKLMDRKFQQMQVEYSESEEEEDAYDQLVSCFGSKSKQRPVSESDESAANGESDAEDVHINETEITSATEGDSDAEDSDVDNKYVSLYKR